MELKTLGSTVRDFIGFDSFPTPKNVSVVTFDTNELTSRCPITGQPDYYNLEISIVPGELCLESKSLKLYLQTFRESGDFGEAMASKIAEEIGIFLKAKWVGVKLTQSPRGGISIKTEAHFRLEVPSVEIPGVLDNVIFTQETLLA